jgi:hypothetical protein
LTNGIDESILAIRGKKREADMDEKKMGRPKKPDAKRPVGIKLSEADIARLAAASHATGLKVNTIIEQGLNLRIEQLEKLMNEGKPFPPKPEER